MNDNMNADEKIRCLYNKTKDVKSPSELDDIILGKIRAIEEQPVISSRNEWHSIAIAASLLVVVFIQLKGTGDETEGMIKKPVEIAELPVKNELVAEQKNRNKNQLPEMFFLPHEDINAKIVPACTGDLVVPEDNQNTLDVINSVKAKPKVSRLPIKPIYPQDNYQAPLPCDSVSSQILKNN